MTTKEKIRRQKRDQYLSEGRLGPTKNRNLKKIGWSNDFVSLAVSRQMGACPICDIVMSRFGYGSNSVNADHCHTYKLPRSILCRRCNLGIGYFCDSACTMLSAADYLEWHAEHPTLFPKETGSKGNVDSWYYRIIGYSPREAGNMSVRGWGPQLFEIRMSDQDFSCAICVNKFADDRHTFVDHDHLTGLPRGILCDRCNSGIGKFDDDPFVIRQAAEYVDLHKIYFLLRGVV